MCQTKLYKILDCPVYRQGCSFITFITYHRFLINSNYWTTYTFKKRLSSSLFAELKWVFCTEERVLLSIWPISVIFCLFIAYITLVLSSTLLHSSATSVQNLLAKSRSYKKCLPLVWYIIFGETVINRIYSQNRI